MDGMPGFIRKGVRLEVKVLDEAQGTVDAVLSDETKDRDGDVIRAAGWDLEDFLVHPVLLSSHVYDSLLHQIGKWNGVGIAGKRLKGEAEYFIGRGNEEADWAFELARRGQAAYSVGFIPGEVKEMRSGGYEFVAGHKLLETSHVSVPSNPQALQLMQRALRGMPATDPMRQILDEMAHDAQDQMRAVRAGKKDVKELDENLLMWMSAGICQMPECDMLDTLFVSLCRTHLAAFYELCEAGENSDAAAMLPVDVDEQVVAAFRAQLLKQADAIIELFRKGGIVIGEPVSVPTGIHEIKPERKGVDVGAMLLAAVGEA